MCVGAQTFPAHLADHRAPAAEAMGSVGVRTDKASRTARLVICIQTIEGTLMNNTSKEGQQENSRVNIILDYPS